MINLTLLTQYATIKRQIAELEVMRKALEPEVIATLEESGPRVAEDYELKLVARTAWKYPQSVSLLEKQLKAHKLLLQANGSAEAAETHYVRCTLKDG